MHSARDDERLALTPAPSGAEGLSDAELLNEVKRLAAIEREATAD